MSKPSRAGTCGDLRGLFPLFAGANQGRDIHGVLAEKLPATPRTPRKVVGVVCWNAHREMGRSRGRRHPFISAKNSEISGRRPGIAKFRV